MTHKLIFDDRCAEFLVFDNKEAAWDYNREYAIQAMKMFELSLKSEDGYIYYRDLCEHFGCQNLTDIPAPLGWDEKQHPDFKYTIQEFKDENKIVIELNPRMLN